jgi:hypothetical protein
MQFSLLCAVCIMFVSCYSGKTNITGEQHQLNVSEENIDTTYFNDHFEIAEVVPLQTDETNLISDIKRLIRYKNQIILLSGNTRQIFIINSKGGVIEQRIHKTGNGPGESNVILDIGFDESSEQLLVYNDYSKLLFFDLQGNFLSETKVDDLYEEMTVVDGKVIFHNKLEGYSCYPLVIKVFNLKDKNWESFGGKSDNAVRIQIHVAIITYCLIGIIEHDLKLGRPVIQVMRILGSSLLTKDDIMELFIPPEDEEKPDDGQLEIEFIYD